MKTVEIDLVATHEIAFDPRRIGVRTIINSVPSIRLPVTPAICATPLGRFLAETIGSTRRNNPASAVRILNPETHAGKMLAAAIREWNDRLEHPASRNLRSADALEAVIASITRRVFQVGTIATSDPGGAPFKTSIGEFEWPVLGSRAAGEIEIPEMFFDFCARKIIDSGGIVVSAGAHGVRPEDDVIKPMARGYGLAILRQHERDNRPGIDPESDESALMSMTIAAPNM